jgi:hypothetical protein
MLVLFETAAGYAIFKVSIQDFSFLRNFQNFNKEIKNYKIVAK